VVDCVGGSAGAGAVGAVDVFWAVVRWRREGGMRGCGFTERRTMITPWTGDGGGGGCGEYGGAGWDEDGS